MTADIPAPVRVVLNIIGFSAGAYAMSLSESIGDPFKGVVILLSLFLMGGTLVLLQMAIWEIMGWEIE